LEQTQIDTAKDVIDIAGNHLLSQFLGIANMRRPGGNEPVMITIVNGEPIGEHFRGDDAPLRAGENEVIAGGVDSPFVFSVFIG
jgi:hypothetical protein